MGHIKYPKMFASSLLSILGLIILVVAGVHIAAPGYGLLPVTEDVAIMAYVLSFLLFGPFIYFGIQHDEHIDKEVEKITEKSRKEGVLFKIKLGNYGERRDETGSE